MSWLQGTRTRLRLLFGRRAAEARMDEEFRFHLEMEAERLVREEGVDPAEARRRATIAFGLAEKHKDELRRGRGLAWLAGMSLDFRLGFRMLVKYPGLAIIGGLAMAFAIWAGVVVFEILTTLLFPTLPLPHGDRIVQLRNWDVVANRQEPRALHDFAMWRERLRSVTELGAYRDVRRNLKGSDGDVRPVDIAEITASAFRLAPTRPVLGRVLLPADEQPGAAPVIAIGHDVWQTRFGSDSTIVGRTVEIGGRYATVVGVMPEGFAFPIAHDAWMPLPPELVDQQPRAGPGVTVFGRLAEGVTREEAQAELATLGRRMSADFPRTHAELRPQVKPYTTIYFEGRPSDRAIMIAIYFFIVMLLVLICSNVAMLTFARAATRESELVVRSALGASRGRIVAQLFAESLVLGGVSAAVALVAAGFVLDRWGAGFLERNMGRLPFWYDLDLSPVTIVAAIALTALAAMIAGVLPALRITRGLGTRLKQGTAGGGGPKFSGIWTAVIVTQVALTVAFPAVVYIEQQELVRIRTYDPGFQAAEFLAVRLEQDRMSASDPDADTTATARDAFGRTLELLRERVAADPAVAGVTFVDRLPRGWHSDPLIEVDDPSGGAGAALPAPPEGELAANIAGIDRAYFDVLGAPILAGRAFNTGDFGPEPRVVIVDREFVDLVLKGENAVGRRVRFRQQGGDTAAAQPWFEIVGVVKELGMQSPATRRRAAGMYLPVPPAQLRPLEMVVHARGDPATLAPRIRAISASVDPDLRIAEMQRLSEINDEFLWVIGMWLRITAALTAIALLLSLAGIYAVLSFTVARRTREIGVRIALGASRRRLLVEIFRRPLAQVSVGVVAGGALIAAMAFAASRTPSVGGGGMSALQLVLLAAYATFMLGVCLLACIVPTRRALAVEPSTALRVD